jgi:hypothetical protein
VIGRDEPRVLHWIGLPALADGARQWFDIAARPTVDHGRMEPVKIRRQLTQPTH